MYILPLWEQVRFATDAVVAEQMDRLIAQLGKGNRYHRTGFASIMPPQAKLEANCKLALARGLSLGVIFGAITHNLSPSLPKSTWSQDLRVYQWRKNGVNWQGYYTGSNAGTLETPADARDYLVPTPSRYAALVQSTLGAQTRASAKELKAVMAAYPGCIAVVNGVIEEEYAVAAALQPDDYLSDYSPFAVTEFRDWLRHTGKYDDTSGDFKGEGAPAGTTGAFIDSGGAKRSPFYDDPSPGDAHGTGKSFNQTFGTAFTTWALRYWDIAAFPAPITDPAFDPTPTSGAGFTAGGFDAPRVRDNSPFWNAWSWDLIDHAGQYPPGDAATQQWGYRQTAIHHWVIDQFQIMVDVGLPKEMMFAHQIPGEALTGFTGGGSRCRSSASPIWTGFLPMNGNVGITRFGPPVNYASIQQYTSLVPSSQNWGIFEWHPLPNTAPDDPNLYDRATRDLGSYYAQKAHYLFPGWWNEKGGAGKTFPLNDSGFARAIKDFLASRPDKPYAGWHCP